MGTKIGELQADTNLDYDRQSEIKAFDDTKAGVKGIVDSGVTNVPRISMDPNLILDDNNNNNNSSYVKTDQFSVPIIDLQGHFGLFDGHDPPDPVKLPQVCRDIVMDYSKRVVMLVFTLLALLSEALGLNPSCLKDMDYAHELLLIGHYYAKCPKPELTIGTSNNRNSDIITVLLYDQLGGLQVLYENQWIDIPYILGALIVNARDLL
ncbi:hypothetical protein PTKIN_Ptkin10aG0042400 [Pterospermum kingtungense]